MRLARFLVPAPLVVCLVMHAGSALGQAIGGQTIYSFLNLSPSARISGLAGSLIAVRDDDIALGYNNPAALNPQMHTALSFNHSFHMAGVQYGYAAYGHHFQKLATTFQGGVQYVTYGEFDRTDPNFQNLGTFKASELALNLGAGRALYDRLAVGVNMKLINSRLESFSSFGLSFDVAATYFDTTSNFVATLLFRNMGFQLSPYREGDRENLPFEIQIGISKKLKYLPFRFSVTYLHLQQWDILYDDPNVDNGNDPLFGEEPQERSPTSRFIDNFFRHLVFNGELLLGKKETVRIRVGYSHRVRKELLVDGFGSLSGFSFGFGIRIKKFRLDYGHSHFHNAGGLNHLSISTRINRNPAPAEVPLIIE